MPVSVPFESLRKMCYAVREAAREEGGPQQTARPFNRFEPDRTSWWLVATTDWPAHGSAKCYFYRSELRGGRFAALHVEKGIDPAVSEAFGSRRADTHAMDRSWAWHPLAESLSDGSLYERVHRLSTEHGARIYFHLLGGYLEQPDEFNRLDPDSLLKWDEALHRWDTRLRRLAQVRYRPRSEVLGNLGFTFRPAEYTRRLLGCAGSPWTWLDLRVGAVFRQAEADGGAEPWGAREIWSRLLGPLMGALL